MSYRHTLSLTHTLSGKVDCYSSDNNTWKGWKYMNTDVWIFYTYRSRLRIRSLSIFDSALVTSKVRHSAIKKTKPNSSTYKIYYATKKRKLINNISQEGHDMSLGRYILCELMELCMYAPGFNITIVLIIDDTLCNYSTNKHFVLAVKRKQTDATIFLQGRGVSPRRIQLV